MKKFQFLLQTLLEVRQQKETVAYTDLMEAQLVLQRMIKLHRDLENELQQLNGFIEEKKIKSIPAAELASDIEYGLLLNKKIIHQQDIINKTLDFVENKRQSLIDAMQRRKIIENLREKRHSEWESEFQSVEKTFFDELATIRFVRKSAKQ